jgi:hypothetical protein
MRDRLEGDRVGRREAFDVIAELLRDIVKLTVWQHRCGREVVRQPQPGQHGGLLAGEVALVHKLVDKVAELEVCQLCRHFEDRLPGRQVVTDLQCLGGWVVSV